MEHSQAGNWISYICGGLLLLLSVIAVGEEPGILRQINLSTMLTAIDDDPSRAADDGFGAQISIGTGFRGHQALDLAVQYLQFDRGSNAREIKQWSIGLDYRLWLGNSQNFKPYLLVGAAYLDTQDKDIDRTDQDGLGLSLGLGVLTPLNKSLGLRTELKARRDHSTDSSRDAFTEVMLSLGLEFPVYRKLAAASDSDGDMVNDTVDRCGSTPAGVDVDSYGCARDMDSDGDGVPNQIDMCGDTPDGTAVDQHGCRMASDTGSLRS